MQEKESWRISSFKNIEESRNSKTQTSGPYYVGNFYPGGNRSSILGTPISNNK
jgi:hypothetical protein